MYFLGYDIGGTKCAVSLGRTQDGLYDSIDIIAKDKFETKGTPYEVLDKMISCAKAILEKERISFTDIARAGISCGGPLDSKRGVILSPPNLPGWDEVRAVEYLTERTGIKTLLQNDANACAVAEWKFGAGRGCSNMVFLTFGTGLGAGLILNGKLYSGTNDNAGEAGHVRLSENGPVGYGKIGSFEGFCSGRGIEQLGRSYATEAFQRGEKVSFCEGMHDLSNITAKRIAECADEGDELAKKVYAKSGEMLGYGLSMLVDILNPERIVIGSVFTRSKHLLFDSCDKVMREQCLSLSYDVCSVVGADLGENIGDYAALALAVSDM